MNITIKQATEADIPIIEDILAGAVAWMDDIGQHQWEYKNVKWAAISQFYGCSPTDFYIAFADRQSGDGQSAACMALFDHDPDQWPDIAPGESLYLHKVAVRRAFAGQGVSQALINFAKDEAKRRGIATLRLDTHMGRHKVRAVYEKQGFVCVEETVLGKYATALYVCEL